MEIGRDHLSGPAATAAQAFGIVTGLLSDVRAAAGELCLRLRELDDVLAGQRGNGHLLDSVEHSAQSVQQAVADASARAAPDKIGTAMMLAQSCLDEICSSTREIDAVAALTKVTSRSLGLTSFDDYVTSLRHLVEAMRRDTAQFSAAVDALQSRRVRAVELFSRANSDLAEVISVLGDVAKERAETEQLLQNSLEDIGTLARRLPADTAAEIEVLVRAMQFADALSQRLDHVGTVLAYPHADPGDTGPLARALIEALVEETHEMAKSVMASLRGIGRLADEVGRIMGHDNESPVSRALQLGRVILSEISGRTGSVLAAIEGAEGESVALRTAAEDATQRFTSLLAATDSMHIYAINAGLLARRDEAQQGAMNVLSVEVQRKAAQCARVVTTCHGAINQLALPDDLAALGAVGPIAQIFRLSITKTGDAVNAAGLACEHLERVRMDTIRATQRLAETTRIAVGAVQSIHAVAAELTNLVQALPSSARPNADPLLALLAVYSMESERMVHHRLFGLEQTRSEAAKPPESEDDLLAAIMF